MVVTSCALPFCNCESQILGHVGKKIRGKENQTALWVTEFRGSTLQLREELNILEESSCPSHSQNGISSARFSGEGDSIWWGMVKEQYGKPSMK